VDFFIALTTFVWSETTSYSSSLPKVLLEKWDILPNIRLRYYGRNSICTNISEDGERERAWEERPKSLSVVQLSVHRWCRIIFLSQQFILQGAN